MGQSTLFASVVYAALVTSFVAIILHFLRRREETRQRWFAIIHAEYKQYMEKLQELGDSATKTFSSDFLLKAHEASVRIMRGENSQTALEELSAATMKFLGQISDSFARAQWELQGLRIVCSPEILSLTDEFIALQQELMALSTRQMGDIRTMHQPDSALTAEIQAKGQHSKNLIEKIVQQMRSELSKYR
jgi:hypothetical protein